MLSAGTDNGSIPVIAVFFALFGFLFVDWLELFALPPIAAYAAMGLATFFCALDFTATGAPGQRQMIAVAQLLVLVQGILMMQRKNRRIFEQLAVFCLLELIVAAVFDSAILYGLLLIPIALISAWAFSLLAALETREGLAACGSQANRDAAVASHDHRQASVIAVSSTESWDALTRRALGLPRIALVMFAPAVLLVGAVFFYALPRVTDAARVEKRGNAMVGFSDELRLEQIGQMMRSNRPAMRVQLTDRASGEPYQAISGLYLRGVVLENYKSLLTDGRRTATWTAAPSGTVSSTQKLPVEYIPEKESEQDYYDNVQVRIVCESMRSQALFSVAPYYGDRTNPEVHHVPEFWTLSRRYENDWVYSRIEYRFATHAFRAGSQTELTAYRRFGDPIEGGLSVGRLGSRLRSLQEQADERRQIGYRERLLDFDIDAMPTVAELAGTFVLDEQGNQRNDYDLAKEMERHFLTNREYEYTLNLNAESIPGLDPIEQFLRVDKRGHCQYFASALVMMLRSRGIPARMVAGYQTDEYNDLGQHYIARQLHAHAWVEALIDREQLGENKKVHGQPSSASYWLRLDPTPPMGRLRQSVGGVGQVFDMAQTIWDDYVVEMDAERQDVAVLGGGSSSMNRSYEQFLDRLRRAFDAIRAGQLGGGTLAAGRLFSWQAAILGCLVTMVLVVLLRIRQPAWIRKRLRNRSSRNIARPSIDFYAELLNQLERLHVVRKANQTPAELAVVAGDRFRDLDANADARPLELLTTAFYQQRFGGSSETTEPGKVSSIGGAFSLRNDGEQRRVERALADLKNTVDSLVIHQKGTE